MQIQTVCGPVDASELGICLPHEHLFLDIYRVMRFRERLLNDMELMVEEVGHFKEAGGGTIVEVTPRDLGRDPEALKALSERTGVHVLMSTGRYREPWYERELWDRSTADLTRELIADLQEGVGGIRAAVIGEIGVDGYHVSPAEERVHRAAARAQKATGAPITTHGIASPVGIEQLDIFDEEGADLTRVIVGHCDSYPFVDYHCSILERGAYVQFDLIRGEPTYRHEGRAQLRLILELISRGFLSRLLLSHDICDVQRLAINGGPGYAYIPTVFAQQLRDAGLSQAEVHTLLVENPRTALTGERASSGG